MNWTNQSFFKMMIYDLERPPDFPPCQEIKVRFNDYQVTHYVSTLVNLEAYLQSLRSLTEFKKSEFMNFVSSVLITTHNRQELDLSDVNHFSDFFRLCVKDVNQITIRDKVQRFECPICIEYKMFPVTPFSCQHFICGTCLQELREYHECSQSCPLCRSPPR